MAVTLSDLDLEAMDTINNTIDGIMTLDDEEYMEASELVLGIVRKYLESLMMQADLPAGSFYVHGGRA